MAVATARAGPTGPDHTRPSADRTTPGHGPGPQDQDHGDQTDDDHEGRTGRGGRTAASRPAAPTTAAPPRASATATCPTTGRPGRPRSSRPATTCSATPSRSSARRIGADVVCEALLRQGVDVFFGYPGGVVLPLYDVLGDYPELRHVLVRHEQGGAHAADGYARVTGRVGVCLGTSGPGATNLVTGIGTALLDSIPMVAITGNVPGALIGKDAFQEIDINGITLPMTKHNYLVRDADDLPRVFAEAFHIARTGRPGPGPHRHHQGRPPAGDVGPAPDRGRGDRRPAGLPAELRRPSPPAQGGRRRDRPGQAPGHPGRPRRPPRRGVGRPARVRREDAASRWPGPLLGIGAIAEDHPLAYGFMGMHGWKHVNRAIQSADLLIAIGMRFDDRVTGNVRTYAPYARIIHVDIDPAEIGKNVAVEVPDRGRRRPRPAGAHRRWSRPRRPADRAPTTSPSWPSGGPNPRRSSWHGSGAWREGS